jgi:hypothetical protein
MPETITARKTSLCFCQSNQPVSALNEVLHNKIVSAYAPEETSTESVVLICVAYRTSCSFSYIGGSNRRLDS